MTTNDTTQTQKGRTNAQTLLKRVIVLTLQPGASKGPAAGGGGYRLNKERIVIGSVVSADVRLVGDGIAPIHAVLELGPSGPAVYDLASETGIFVNGKKTVTQILKEGDTIKVGLYSLAFSIEDTTKL